MYSGKTDFLTTAAGSQISIFIYTFSGYFCVVCLCLCKTDCREINRKLFSNVRMSIFFNMDWGRHVHNCTIAFGVPCVMVEI